jgi:hypothetical protein
MNAVDKHLCVNVALKLDEYPILITIDVQAPTYLRQLLF